jgi:hypothetical protein
MPGPFVHRSALLVTTAAAPVPPAGDPDNEIESATGIGVSSGIGM